MNTWFIFSHSSHPLLSYPRSILCNLKLNHHGWALSSKPWPQTPIKLHQNPIATISATLTSSSLRKGMSAKFEDLVVASLRSYMQSLGGESGDDLNLTHRRIRAKEQNWSKHWRLKFEGHVSERKLVVGFEDPVAALACLLWTPGRENVLQALEPRCMSRNPQKPGMHVNLDSN